MNRLIRIGILWSLAISIASAQEADTSEDGSNQRNPDVPQASAGTVSADSKAVVLVIDADGKQSEFVKQIVEALEQAGVATSLPTEPAPSPEISVALLIRKDESSEKITTLIAALTAVGVRQISLRTAVETQVPETSVLTLTAQPGYTIEALHRIEGAARTAANQCGLTLGTAVKGLKVTANGELAFQTSDDIAESDDANIAAIKMKEGTSDVIKVNGGPAAEIAPVLAQTLEKMLKHPVRLYADAESNSILVPHNYRLTENVMVLAERYIKFRYSGSANHGGKDSTEPRFPSPVADADLQAESTAKLLDTRQSTTDQLRSEYSGAKLVAQLQDEMTKLLQSVGPTHPRIVELQARIDAARNTAANSISEDAVFLLPNDVFQWNLMAPEIVKELKKDQEAFSRLHGTNGPRVNYFDEAIEGFQNLHGAWLFDEEMEIAEFWEEFKTKYQPLIEKGPDALRAERDRLIEKNNSENDEQIVELEILTAWATVQQRYRDRNASLMRGAGAAALEDAVRVSQGSRRELQQQLAQLRKDYSAANNQAHDLAESLRQTPDAAKKAELRAAVQRAFTARQSLLRAELQEMQARLEKTQQSLDMRDRIADQIVDRRVEDLLNPEFSWDTNAATDATESTTSAANRSSKSEATAPVTELEGDWHWASGTDSLGKPIEISPYNVSFKSDLCTIAFQGGQFDRRVRVDPDSTRIFGFMDNRAFLADNYRVEGDQLKLSGDGVTMVYQRGHVTLSKTIPNTTEEQKSRWRSGIVEILGSPSADKTWAPQLIGYGVLISPKMRIVSQTRAFDADSAFYAKFDDGGVVPLKIVEKGPQGWLVFEPEQAIEANHIFRFSETNIGQHDEVHFWGRGTEGDSPKLRLSKTTVSDLERKSPALGHPVWQLLFQYNKLDGSLPILDANGDLLAITVIGSNELLLAVPVSQLKTMFPESFGPAAQEAK